MGTKLVKCTHVDYRKTVNCSDSISLIYNEWLWLKEEDAHVKEQSFCNWKVDDVSSALSSTKV